MNYLERDQFVAHCGGVWQAMETIQRCRALSNSQVRVATMLLCLDHRQMPRRPGAGTIAAAIGKGKSAAADDLKSMEKSGHIKLARMVKSRKTWVYAEPRFWRESKDELTESFIPNIAFPTGSDRKSERPAHPDVSTEYQSKSTAYQSPAYPDKSVYQRPGGAYPCIDKRHKEPPSIPPLAAVDDSSGRQGVRVRPEQSINFLDEQRGATARARPDAAALVEAARSEQAQRKASADTELVAGLCRILGEQDRGQWCRLDSLMFRVHRVRGRRRDVTRMVLDWARAAMSDQVEQSAAVGQFKRTVCNRFHEVGEAWMKKAVQEQAI